MIRRTRLLSLAAVVTVGALAAAGWVAAQQGDPAAGAVPAVPAPAPKAAVPPPAITPAEAPPLVAVAPAATPAPASSDAADADTDDDTGSSDASAAAALKPAQPMTRPRFGVAVIQAMDKVTAETIRFEAPVGKPIRYKSLIFIVRACETTAPDEAISDAAAFVEIDSVPMAQEGAVAAPARQVFRGWMFANAPGLHLFQNPAYDAWAIACKTASPAA